jgi:hypothetical protein
MRIPGLPEGVDGVRIGRAGPDEYELIGDHIERGPRHDSISQVIVVPADGYKFNIDPKSLYFYPVKVLDPPVKLVVTVTYHFDNEKDQEITKDWLERLKQLPGFVEVKAE